MKLYAIIPFTLQTLAWPIAHFIFRINGTFTVHGRENLTRINGPVIFAANHLNELDPVITRAILPMFSVPLFWVARPRNHYTWKGWRAFLYGDLFFRAWGAYPAYKGYEDYKKSLQHHIKILQDGFSICIFPQGLKAKDQGVDAPVHGGVAYLAQATNIPIIPVAISGTSSIDAKKLFFGKKNITVKFGKPVYIKEPDGKDSQAFYKKEAQKIMGQIYLAKS